MHRVLNKRVGIVFLFVIGVALVIFFWTNSRNAEANHLVDVDTNRLTQIVSNEENALVYIGRPTCSMCQEFKPELEKKLLKSRKNLFYLNTDEHRSENGFGDVLEKISVDSVPVIVKMKNGEAISWFTYDDFKQGENLDDWLK